MTLHEAYIALNLIEGVGPATLAQLLKVFDEPQNILSAGIDRLMSVQGVGPVTAAAIRNWEETVDLQSELQRIKNAECRVIITEDEEYPPLLREIYNPPFLLYVKGRILPQDKGAVSIVGSRLTTLYGRETAYRLAQQLAYAGITVVSGGASGIDSAAHQGALSARGRTLAVLGNGLNHIYPAGNAELFEKIAENGALISQFPMDRAGDRQTFPIRNRIVAGMTLGTVVVEANQSSGALITAGMAAELNRQVFAVPGRIDSPRSSGCHRLIKEGAKLCEGVQDILNEFECFAGLAGALREAPPPPAETKSEKTDPEQLPFSLPITAVESFTISMSEHELTVFGCMSSQEQHVDELIRASKLPSSAVQSALFGLELKKQVEQLPGKFYRKKMK
ncbi:MAG TPA: DNA-processing protein DprA [Verrucomicrobiota bacterium]|jgi:DNA processing protein|nr:DNA-processing protein DprA [Verrucomicrobiota bacterium]